MPVIELPGRFSDNSESFMARLLRYYKGCDKGTTVFIKPETPEHFGVQYTTLEENIPKPYLQWDKDRCAMWRLRTNNGEKEEDLTAMPTESERAAYVASEAHNDSSVEPTLRKQAVATKEVGGGLGAALGLPKPTPAFLRSNRKGKPVQEVLAGKKDIRNFKQARLTVADISIKFDQLELEQRGRFFETIGNSDNTQLLKCLDILSDDTSKRDRYTNVFPFDYNRIHLAAIHGGNDYINASHIITKQTNGEERQYVVTQVYTSDLLYVCGVD
jgi:hypothetical protein